MTDFVKAIFVLAAAVSFSLISSLAQVASAPPGDNFARGYRVAGIVVSSTDAHPLARARVTIRDVRNPKAFASLVTADDGRFEFLGIPAGKYSLGGVKRWFIPASYDQHGFFSTAIVTGMGFDTENLVLKLAPVGAITGKILDESGEPVRQAHVSLYYDDHREGIDQIQQIRDVQSDDLGAYEMTPLQPGTYFLSVTATPWYAVHPHADPNNTQITGDQSAADRSLDVAYPTTYYADVVDSDSATPIPIRGGERLEVDFHLNPVPALRLILRSSGSAANGFYAPQLQQHSLAGPSFVPHGDQRMISPGVWEMTGVPAGQYDIRLQGSDGPSQMGNVNLNRDGEEIEISSGEALSTVKVSAQLLGENMLPPQLTVGLRPKGRTLAGSNTLDSKGMAEIEHIPAGRYEVVIWGSRYKRYWISRISAEGAEVSGHDVIVKPANSPSISITLTAGVAELDGVVKKAGKPFAGAMVVLVPKEPEGHRDLFRLDQSDMDGTFTMRDIVPGSYTILAIENGWDLDWAQPAVIAAYGKHGRKLEIGSHPLESTEVELQTK